MNLPFTIQKLLLLGFPLLLILFSCNEDDSSLSSGQNGGIPDELTYYQIDIEGETWTPFSRSGCFFVSPTTDLTPSVNFNNGLNERELGFVSGFPAGNPQPGALWFFSNTAACQYGNVGCNSTPINAALDIAFVDVNESSRTISVRIDGQVKGNATAGNILTANYLNNFTANSGITATLYQVATGTFTLKFSSDGEKVTGTIDITGGNFNGTGTAPYKATFSGKKGSVSNCR